MDAPGNKECLPLNQTFEVKDVASLACVHVQKGSWLGAYKMEVFGLRLICVARSGLALSRKYSRFKVAGPTMLRCAETKRGLTPELWPGRLNSSEIRWRELKQKAFEAIGEARRRSDPQYRWLPDDPESRRLAVDDAKRFLHSLATEARSMGKKRGRRPDTGTSRKMIEAFKRLYREGKIRLANTKDALPESIGDSDPLESVVKKLRTQLRRFCLRVYRAHNHTISGDDVFDCGFTHQEWGLAKGVASVGRWYAERDSLRHPARIRAIGHSQI
jgi:hypothetical protein